MYEEWFEKLAKKLEVERVIQTKNSVEIYLSPEISNNIDGEALFMDAYNISKMFRFQMKNNRLIIILDTIKLTDHYLIPLTKLLNQVTFRPSNID